jgi:predicted alpha/beta hydrolase family esterase
MRAADADILIMPGINNSGPDHWQSRWQAKLSTARRVVQRDWDSPSHESWVETIEREVARCTRPVVCVTHSLGGVALIFAAPRIADNVAGAFIVAPPSEGAMRERGADPALLPFPRRPLPFPSLFVASRDDPYATLEYSRQLALDLGSQFIDAGAAGHINVESGHGPWPEGSIHFAAFVSKL